MSVFVHAQGIKTVPVWGGAKKWQKSVHVVVEWPLIGFKTLNAIIYLCSLLSNKIPSNTTNISSNDIFLQWK